MNNDGYDDLIVGAWENDAGGPDAGRAYVYSGQSGALLHTFTGEAVYDRFGWSVSGAGDVNNDGFYDLIVGARYNSAGGYSAGRAYVYSGLSGEALHTFTGEAEGDFFGFSVSGAGDVNNDGFDDLIVGAYLNSTGGFRAGKAYVYSGQSGALLHTFTGESEGDFLGWSVSGAGNVDGDSFADIIVGALWNDVGGQDAGRAYVYACSFFCGDIDSSGGVDVADLTFLVDYLFRGGLPPAMPQAADVDGSGGIDVADLTYLVDYLFRGGPEPVCE